MRRRRLLIVAGLLLIAMAVLPGVALARGGSGASGFSSGGGFSGGGFSGGGSGHGFALYVVLRLVIDLIIFGHGLGLLIVIALAIGAYLYFFGGARIADWFTAQRQRGPAKRRQAKLRQRRVELAAAEAADSDAAFSPDRVRAAAEQLFIDVQSAWDRGDVATLRTLIAPRLMGEWERRLAELDRRGMKNHVELTGPPKVEYIGIGRGARRSSAVGGGPDRVVVRIEARIRDWVIDRYGREANERGAATKTVRMREYWTLERNPNAVRGDEHQDDHGLGAEFDLSMPSAVGGDWLLSSIEQGAEGAHQLEARIVQTEWADDQALQDEALVEQANADAATLPAGMQIRDLTDTAVAIDQDARARALDLSLADGRFAPDILEVAARRAVQAWTQAIDGTTQPLLALASTDAVQQMLYPAGPASRLVVRGPKIERIAISALDALSVPATMTIDVKINGRRYLQNRADAAILAGSDIHAVTFTERWTLSLSGDAENPWQITGASSAALSR